MKKANNYSLLIAAFVAFGLLVVGMWLLERWFNWTFSYGGKVEQRIEQIEKRIDALEECKKGGKL
jgi:high-affinity Fe2+/Pb2+ permease